MVAKLQMIFWFIFLMIMTYFHLSGKDNMLPSREEGRRLMKSIQNCKMRYFKDNGHTILLVGEALMHKIFSPEVSEQINASMKYNILLCNSSRN